MHHLAQSLLREVHVGKGDTVYLGVSNFLVIRLFYSIVDKWQLFSLAEKCLITDEQGTLLVYDGSTVLLVHECVVFDLLRRISNCFGSVEGNLFGHEQKLFELVLTLNQVSGNLRSVVGPPQSILTQVQLFDRAHVFIHKLLDNFFGILRLYV